MDPDVDIVNDDEPERLPFPEADNEGSGDWGYPPIPSSVYWGV